MIEILRFVFSSFWVWLGTVLLICAIIESIGTIIAALRGASCDFSIIKISTPGKRERGDGDD